MLVTCVIPGCPNARKRAVRLLLHFSTMPNKGDRVMLSHLDSPELELLATEFSSRAEFESWVDSMRVTDVCLFPTMDAGSASTATLMLGNYLAQLLPEHFV